MRDEITIDRVVLCDIEQNSRAAGANLAPEVGFVIYAIADY